MTRLLLTFSLAICVLALGSEAALAGKFNRHANIGEKAAAWENLQGTDGKKHSLEDYKKAEVLVIAFTCNHCPVANAYEARFNKLAETFADRKVKLVAISVSDSDVDSLKNMTDRANPKPTSSLTCKTSAKTAAGLWSLGHAAFVRLRQEPQNRLHGGFRRQHEPRQGGKALRPRCNRGPARRQATCDSRIPAIRLQHPIPK